MSFLIWTGDPSDGPPPFGPDPHPYIYLDSRESYSWAVDHLDIEALRADIRASGLRYKSGYGNGYRLNGKPIAPGTAACVIAGVIKQGSDNLANYLADSLASEIVRDADEELANIDQASARAAELRQERQYAADALPHGYDLLHAYYLGTRDTAKDIERWPSVQAKTLEAFRPCIPAYSQADELARFLSTRPPGFVARSQLTADARKELGDSLKKSAVIAAADKLFGPAKRQHPGTWGYLVP